MPVLDPTLTRVIVADVHGDHAALQTLLEEIGAVDEAGDRCPGYFVLQLGDLIHAGFETGEDDILALTYGREACDVILCGNHELFHAYGLAAGYFMGMTLEPWPELKDGLRELVDQHQLRPAVAVDEWLCTHAGVHPAYQSQLPAQAHEAAEVISARFAARLVSGQEDPLFDSAGELRSAGGDNRPGGIFWCDSAELTSSEGPQPELPQIVGHTPQASLAPTRLTQQLWVNDVGAALSGKLAALVRDGPEGEWRPTVVASPTRGRLGG